MIFSLKQIGGEIAKWACRQSPYGMPEDLPIVLAQFYQTAADDFANSVRSPWDRWREFLDQRTLERYIGDRLLASGFASWNRPKIDKGAPFAFVTRHGGPAPDYDFIDLDALLRNIAVALWDEAERET